MKNINNLKDIVIGILFLICLIFLSKSFLKEDTVSPCGFDKQMIIANFQEWISNGILQKDSRIKNNPIKVIDMAGAMEYNGIPEVMNIPLYEDFKDSRVCKATLLIDFSPNGQTKNIEEINVRFQKGLSSPDEDNNRFTNISVSGIDVQNMTDEALKLFKKHNK